MTDTALTTPAAEQAPKPKSARRKRAPVSVEHIGEGTSDPVGAAKPARAKKEKAGEKGKAGEEEHARIRIKIRAYDHKIVDESSRTIVETAKRSGATVRGPVPLPTERRRYTVNRSPFIDKDARDQYEMRVHKRLLDILDPTPKTVAALTTLNLPAGVSIEVKM